MKEPNRKWEGNAYHATKANESDFAFACCHVEVAFAKNRCDGVR